MNSKNNLRHNSISLSYLILAYLGLLFKDEDFFVSDASPRRGAPKLLARQPLSLRPTKEINGWGYKYLRFIARSASLKLDTFYKVQTNTWNSIVGLEHFLGGTKIVVQCTLGTT